MGRKKLSSEEKATRSRTYNEKRRKGMKSLGCFLQPFTKSIEKASRKTKDNRSTVNLEEACLDYSAPTAANCQQNAEQTFPQYLENALKSFALLEQESGLSNEELRAAQERLEIMASEKKIRKKQKDELNDAWLHKEEDIFVSFVSSLGCLQKHCELCSKTLHNAIKCNHCKKHLCESCDLVIHLNSPFHLRNFYESEVSCRKLLSHEFVDEQTGKLTTREVAVPVFCPLACWSCLNPGTCFLIPGSSPCIVVTKDGRFDLHESLFKCKSCYTTRVATVEDYVAAGYFPGTPERTNFFVSADLAEFWYNLKYLTPGTSEQKFIETLSAVSIKAGRVGTINTPLFNKAVKAYDYINHLVDTKVRHSEKRRCRCCTPFQLCCHVDGNHKLIRRMRHNESLQRSWFGDAIILHDNEFSALNNQINALKPQGKKTIGAQKCGNSQFEAAREVSKRYKGLDVTGNVMTSCGHGVIQCSIDMHEGETFRHTFASHIKVHSMKNGGNSYGFQNSGCQKEGSATKKSNLNFGPKFFVNDVVCHYWPFAMKMGELVESYKCLTIDMEPFLSRLHGQAHSWPCQILNFGHWRDGAAGILGEEQEQVFATFSRYSNSTKTMSEGSRRDFLTGAMFYWNARKEKGMARMLTSRLLIAMYRVEFYRRRLTKLLSDRNITVLQLSAIQAELEDEARHAQDKEKRTNSKYCYLSELKTELELLHFQYVTLHDRISSVAVSSKWRTKLRRKQTLVKKKANKVIDDINDLAQVLVTEQHFLDGVFPWDKNHKIAFKDNFKLVDCWMLAKRNEEQISQCKLEMSQFINSITQEIFSLREDIRKSKLNIEVSDCQNDYRLTDSLFRKSEIIIKSQEIHRLQTLLVDSLAYKKFFYKDGQENNSFVFEEDFESEDSDDNNDEENLFSETDCESDNA